MSKPVLAFGVAVLAFAAYANSLGNGFVWDDPIILARQLPVFRSAAEVLLPPAQIPQYAPDYYRPLVIASYLLDRALGGGEPWVFHLTVVLAHVLATVAVFTLGDLVFRRLPELRPSQATAAAALGAALFAVHPVHTEAVAWVAGRADVFAGLFATTAVYAHLRSRRDPAFALLAGAALLLALLSKEVAIALLLLLPLLDLVVAEGSSAAPPAAARAARRRAGAPSGRATTEPTLWSPRRYGPLLAAVALYGALRLVAIGSGLTTRSAPSPESLPLRLIGALGVYLGKLVLPLRLNAYIAALPQDPLPLLACAAATALFAAALVLVVRCGSGALSFLALWIALTLAPSLTILVKIPEAPVSERYLYWPSVGFCLLLGYAAVRAFAARAPALRWSATGAAAALLAGFFVVTVARNRVWSSDLLLWDDTVAKSPSSGMPLRSLGGALLRENRVAEAERAYEEALDRFNTVNGQVTILANLGTIALGRGDLSRAEEMYRRAVETQATPDAVFNLGVISLRRAQAAEAAGDAAERRRRASTALAELQRAETASPHDPDIQLALGQALALLDRDAEAKERFRRALTLGLAGESAAQVRALLASP